MTISAMKNAESMATISSLFASFSPPTLNVIPEGNSYVFAYSENILCTETVSTHSSRSASTVISISPSTRVIDAVAFVISDSMKSLIW